MRCCKLMQINKGLINLCDNSYLLILEFVMVYHEFFYVCKLLFLLRLIIIMFNKLEV